MAYIPLDLTITLGHTIERTGRESPSTPGPDARTKECPFDLKTPYFVASHHARQETRRKIMSKEVDFPGFTEEAEAFFCKYAIQCAEQMEADQITDVLDYSFRRFDRVIHVLAPSTKMQDGTGPLEWRKVRSVKGGRGDKENDEGGDGHDKKGRVEDNSPVHQQNTARMTDVSSVVDQPSTTGDFDENESLTINSPQANKTQQASEALQRTDSPQTSEGLQVNDNQLSDTLLHAGILHSEQAHQLDLLYYTDVVARVENRVREETERRAKGLIGNRAQIDVEALQQELAGALTFWMAEDEREKRRGGT